jgi:hypothetical protein
VDSGGCLTGLTGSDRSDRLLWWVLVGWWILADSGGGLTGSDPSDRSLLWILARSGGSWWILVDFGGFWWILMGV